MRADRGVSHPGTGAFDYLYEPSDEGGPLDFDMLVHRDDWPLIRGFLANAQALGFDPYDEDIVRRAVAAGERAHAAAPVLPKSTWGTRQQHLPLVYFVQLGPLVKIGTTGNIMQRIASLNPERVLALTEGGRDVERAFHERFATTRRHGEWFGLSPELGAHIAELRERFEADNGVTVEEWLGRH